MENDKIYVCEGGDGFNGFNIFKDVDCRILVDQWQYDSNIDITEQQNDLIKKIRKEYPNAIFCGILEPLNI